MNAERADARTTGLTEVTLKQFAAEFAHQRRGLFDRFVGGLNRLPRPMPLACILYLEIVHERTQLWLPAKHCVYILSY